MIHAQQALSESRPWATSKENSLVVVQELRHSTSSSPKAKRNVKKTRCPPQAPSSAYSTLSPLARGIPEDLTQPDGMALQGKEGKDPLHSPAAKEFQQAQDHHSILASTGCTKQFCQAGRAAHTDEPRIGENRALEVIEKEAEGFLRELHREHFFDSDEAFKQRLNDVLAEIKTGACEGVIREGKQHGKIGGSWKQTPEELEFGLRRAWRNARKCIMRSHCDELK